MFKMWCMCTELKGVARDMKSTCSICGGVDAYGLDPDRPAGAKKAFKRDNSYDIKTEYGDCSKLQLLLIKSQKKEIEKLRHIISGCESALNTNGERMRVYQNQIESIQSKAASIIEDIIVMQNENYPNSKILHEAIIKLEGLKTIMPKKDNKLNCDYFTDDCKYRRCKECPGNKDGRLNEK